MENTNTQDKRLSQNHTQQNHTTDTTDSSKVCHSELTVNVAFSGLRKHTSFRCDSNLWKAFKSVCKNNGLSTCDILEKLILGFCVGYSTRVAQPTTIDVVVDAPRLVKRVRRRQLMFEGEVEEFSRGEGVRVVPFYDLGAGGLWKSVSVEGEADVNVNGHFWGCGCSRCGGLKRDE